MHPKNLLTYYRFLLALALLLSSASWACPLCHTSTAAEVRQGLKATLQDKSIWAATVLPFFAIGGVIKVMNSNCLNRESHDKEEADTR